MSVSYEERSEIVQRLRKLEIGVIGTVIPTVELVKNILKAIDYSHSNAMTPYGRLADLIEPEPERTCRMIDNGCELCCSECDGRHEYDEEPNYCHNCGARVVEVVD